MKIFKAPVRAYAPRLSCLPSLILGLPKPAVGRDFALKIFFLGKANHTLELVVAFDNFPFHSELYHMEAFFYVGRMLHVPILGVCRTGQV